VEITNLSKYRIDENSVKKVAKNILEEINLPPLPDFSLVFVDEQTIQQINHTYRRKNRPTDVLSFEGLNEIFICPQMVEKQARRISSPFKSELMRVLLHGILHLGGFDHEKSKKEADKMEEKEKQLLNKFIPVP